MSEDLISKEKAYNVLTEYYHHRTEMQHKALREALDMVPSAEPRWIPVTQQLPEIGEKVLVSTKYTVFTQVFKCIYGTPDRWGWEHNTIKNVTAWMPMPEPYQGGEQE